MSAQLKVVKKVEREAPECDTMGDEDLRAALLEMRSIAVRFVKFVRTVEKAYGLRESDLTSE